MLYGNIIFIKKGGGDGSKYPVTEKNVKIGRSDECLIRIHNTQVALEHCQLIIGDNGQATLKDLSKQTILNGNLLDHEEVTLCHGDIFKLGERLARWEYLPTSKYYKQLLSPTGRLVAVVMPQQRSLEDQPIPGTSASFVSVLKSTPVGGKRRCSERFASESSSAMKVRKSNSSDLIRKSKVDLSKFLTGRHSLKSTKLLLPGTKIRDRKSTSGIVNSKTPKSKSRKSALPSWKVNAVTPPTKSTGRSSLPAKSRRKSTDSPKNRVKNSVMNFLKLESEKSLDTLRNIRTPQKFVTSSEDIVKSTSKAAPKTALKTIRESPLRGEGLKRSQRSFSKSPPQKASSEAMRLVHSEKKLRSSIRKSSVGAKKLKRSSLVLTGKELTKKNLNKKFYGSFALEELSSGTEEISSVKTVHPALEISKSEGSQVKGRRSSVKSSTMKTPGKLEKTPKKHSVRKGDTSPEEILKTPRMSSVKKKLMTPGALNTMVRSSSIDLEGITDSKRKRQTPLLKSPSGPGKDTPFEKISQVQKSVQKAKPSSSRKVVSKANSPVSSPVSRKNSSVQASTSSGNVKLSSGRTSRKSSLSRERTSSSRGVRRKLSPAISSAERAAKKLKVSSPRKPDKNKKAALLVLGKANRKQLFSQNMKVLLKQKIVKRAIKQSTTTAALQNGNVKKTLTAVKAKAKKGKSKTKAKKRGSSTSSPKSPEVSLHRKDEEVDILKDGNESKAKLLNFAMSGERSESGSKAKDLFNDSRSSVSHQKPESSQLVPPKSPTKERSFENLERRAENFMYNLNRRSKRLSSKNDTSRPDFVELSPTALGLIPKNIEIFKTPVRNKRNSSSLITPKNDQCTGIIRSASTSKIGNRKSVRFSSKDGSEFSSPNPSEKTDFDFGACQTPDVSVDVFISPLGAKSNASKIDLSESPRITFPSADESALARIYKSSSEPRKCVRKLLQSPQPSNRKSPIQKEIPVGTRSTSKSPASTRNQKQSGSLGVESPEGERRESEHDIGVFTTPKAQRNSKSSTSERSKRVFRSLKVEKAERSPKNDLSDLRGVKKLLETPKAPKSPRNDLSDVRGVKKLLATPKIQKSPKNDLSDLRGVRKLLVTPKVQKSPKNDLTDVRGVKKLVATPKTQKSPKNDLSDLRGVKRLLKTPKEQKSPKNDLSDVRGVKKLLGTPKVQKSPKNDLSDVRGVKKLLGTPKVQKSPRNDLSDVRGVKKLLTTPKVQKTPKNDLSDVRGVKKLLGTPKMQKSPKNDLTDVAGVKELLKTPKIELFDVSGGQTNFTPPKLRRISKSDVNDSEGAEKEGLIGFVKENLAERTSPRLQRSRGSGLTEKEKLMESPIFQSTNINNMKLIKELAKSPDEVADVSGRLSIAQSPRKVSSNKKTVSPVTQANDSKVKRGVKVLTAKGPKNDLSDVTGVRELFSRHESKNDLNVSLTGVPNLFDLPEAEAVSSLKLRKSSRKPTTAEEKVSTALLPVKAEEDEGVSTRSTRGSRLRNAGAGDGTKRAVRTKLEVVEETAEDSTDKAKAVKTNKKSQRVKSPPVVKRTLRAAKERKESEETTQVNMKAGDNESEVKNSRKRKTAVTEVVPSPPKLRRKQPVGAKSDAAVPVRKTTSRSKTASASTVRQTANRVTKASTRGREKTSKASTKVQNKRSQSVLERNPSASPEELSPVKTRSKVKAGTQAKRSKSQNATTVEKKSSKSTPGRKNSPSAVKRSTRRK